MQMTRLDAAVILTNVFPQSVHRDTVKRLETVNAAKLEEALQCGRLLAGSAKLSDILTWARGYVRTHGQV